MLIVKISLISKKNETHDASDTAVSSFARTSHHVSREVSIAEAESAVNRKFSISASENIEVAKQHFGTTKDWTKTGYLLSDGTQLDFSGRHWGGDSGDKNRYVRPSGKRKRGKANAFPLLLA